MCAKINIPVENVFYAPSKDKYNCTSTQTVLKIGLQLHNVVTLLQCKLGALAQINNLLSLLHYHHNSKLFSTTCLIRKHLSLIEQYMPNFQDFQR